DTARVAEQVRRDRLCGGTLSRNSVLRGGNRRSPRGRGRPRERLDSRPTRRGLREGPRLRGRDGRAQAHNPRRLPVGDEGRGGRGARGAGVADQTVRPAEPDARSEVDAGRTKARLKWK